MIQKEIGERIKSKRDARGFSQPQLAIKSGVHKSVISQYEKGAVKDPSVIILNKLANPLRVSGSWLCFGSGIDHSKDDELLTDYFKKCKVLPTKEKRFILEVLKRVVALNNVSNAINQVNADEAQDYSMS